MFFFWFLFFFFPSFFLLFRFGPPGCGILGPVHFQTEKFRLLPVHPLLLFLLSLQCQSIVALLFLLSWGELFKTVLWGPDRSQAVVSSQLQARALPFFFFQPLWVDIYSAWKVHPPYPHSALPTPLPHTHTKLRPTRPSLLKSAVNFHNKHCSFNTRRGQRGCVMTEKVLVSPAVLSKEQSREEGIRCCLTRRWSPLCPGCMEGKGAGGGGREGGGANGQKAEAFLVGSGTRQS